MPTTPRSVERRMKDATMATEKKPGSLDIEITGITKFDGPLTKRIYLGADGERKTDSSLCKLWRGSARRVQLAGVDAFAEYLNNLHDNQAITLGSLRGGLSNKVSVTTKKALQKINGVEVPNLIARTHANLVHQPGRRGFVLFDYDTNKMPRDVSVRLERLGGFWPALISILPELKGVRHVHRSSTSAGLSRSDTGEEVPGSDGLHIYPEVKDVSDSERFLRAAHGHCWLGGLGWYVVSRSGQLLERSIIDRMVGSAERLVFEGGPVLDKPLRQDQKCRRAIAVDGKVLDTIAACPPLTIVEKSLLDELKAKEAHRLAPEVAKARAAFIERQAKKLIKRTKISESAAKQIVLRQCEGILRPNIELPFDDPDLAGCTVGDVLADPDRFEGRTLADPLEGIDDGPCKAKIMRRADGSVWIHSFAHGRTTYELKYDATSIRVALQTAAKEEIVATFAKLMVIADVDAVEMEALRQLVQQLSSVGMRVIDSALKAAQQTHAKQRSAEVRRHRAALRSDPRPHIRTPFRDEPWLPQMDTLNAVIGGVKATKPPSRDIDGVVARARKLPVPNLHAFTQSDANVEPEGDDK
jgi:hypothetical protein